MIENPYQSNLDLGLAECGYQVVKQPRLRVLAALKENLSVIHLHWLPQFGRSVSGTFKLYLFSVRLLLLRLCGIRIIWTLHNLYSHESLSKGNERLSVRLVAKVAHRIIIHSPKAKPLFEQEFSTEFSDKLVCIPHGTYVGVYDNTISRQSAREQLGYSNETVFLFLGNIRPYKGVELLIEAFSQIPEKNIRLLIVGKPIDDKLKSKLTAAAEADGRVRLVFEFVPDDEIQLYFNASDVVVFPYKEVLTSGAVILAMSFAKACIVGDVGCMRESLHENGGICYSASNPEGLKEALMRAIELGEPKLNQMGINNYQVARDLGWSKIAAQTVEAYESN